MLGIIQGCFGFLRPAVPCDSAPQTTVLVVRVPAHPAAPTPAVDPLDRSSACLAAAPATRCADRLAVQPTHQGRHAVGRHRQEQRAAAAALRSLNIFSPKELAKLRRAGLRSCEELLAAKPEQVVQQLGAPQRWAAKLRRCQRAIRFSARFSEMTPLEALMLFATHRRSRIRLAADSPGVLKRDLERLLLSSRGQRLAGDRAAPDIARVRLWVCQARTHGAVAKPKSGIALDAAAAARHPRWRKSAMLAGRPTHPD